MLGLTDSDQSDSDTGKLETKNEKIILFLLGQKHIDERIINKQKEQNIICSFTE